MNYLEMYTLGSAAVALVSVGVAMATAEEHLVMPQCIIAACAGFMWPAALLIGLGYLIGHRLHTALGKVIGS